MVQTKTVVVTGASRGIGLATIKALEVRGVHVLACARGPIDDSSSIASLHVDLRDPEAPHQIVETALERFGTIDAWINNAATLTPIGPAHTHDPRALRDALALNVTALTISSTLFAEHVARREGSGVLVNLSSGAAGANEEGWAHYCGAKAYVDRFTEVLAVEGRAFGLRAMSVAPGVVDTEMQAEIRSTPKERFPSRERFVELFETGSLKHPDIVGAQLADLALGEVVPPDVVFRLD